jgi:adenylate kinase
MRGDSELANQVRGYVDRGELVPDELTAQVLFSRLDELAADKRPTGALFDGYPRNKAQAEVLDKTIRRRGESLAAIVHLDVPLDVLRARIAGRAAEERRSDDTPEALDRRLRIYFDETKPLIERWRDRGIVLDVNGDQTVDFVAADITRGVAELLGQGAGSDC